MWNVEHCWRTNKYAQPYSWMNKHCQNLQRQHVNHDLSSCSLSLKQITIITALLLQILTFWIFLRKLNFSNHIFILTKYLMTGCNVRRVTAFRPKTALRWNNARGCFGGGGFVILCDLTLLSSHIVIWPFVNINIFIRKVSASSVR